MAQSQNPSDQQTFNNELRGALFRNDKGDNPARPDYRGNCTIDSKFYRISAWIQEARGTGQKFLSMSYTRDETKDPKPAQSALAPEAAADESDIPF